MNDRDYHGGFERDEIERVFEAMESNYEAWARGFAPLSVGADVPAAVTVFDSDLRGALGLVVAPCSVVQAARDASVPLSVAGYPEENLGGKTTVEMLRTEGHLPRLSAPAILAPVLRRLLLR